MGTGSNGDFNQYFHETCEVVDLSICEVGTDFLDPCDCRKHYKCSQPQVLEMLHQTCGATTGWDHDINNCDFINNIYTSKCEKDRPWTRCNVTADRLAEVEELCTGVPPTSTSTLATSTPTTSTTTQETASKIDAGLVVGLVVAGAVFALIVVAVAVVVWRRRKAQKAKKAKATQAVNMEYFEGNADDPYAIIDDSMQNPEYNHGGSYLKPSPRVNGSRVVGSLDGDTLAETLPRQEPDVEYDNPGSKREPEPGYSGFSDNRRSSDSYARLKKAGKLDTDSPEDEAPEQTDTLKSRDEGAYLDFETDPHVGVTMVVSEPPPDNPTVKTDVGTESSEQEGFDM